MEILIKEIEKFINNTHYSEGTKKRNKRHLDIFTEELALISNTHPSDLHLERIYELIDSNGRQVRYKSINYTLIDMYLFSNIHKGYSWLCSSFYSLSSFFKYLYRVYEFPNIMLQTKFRLEEYRLNKPSRILSRSQILKFMNIIISSSSNLQRDSLLFILLLSTGSRISEVLGIKVENIDIENEFIFIKNTKNNSSKNIILRDGYGAVLKTYIDSNQLTNNSYLFNNDGKKLSRVYVQQLFNSFLSKASLPQTNLHSLRKSFATLMVESGTDIVIIQQLLNHKALNSTKTYIDPNYIRNMGIIIDENKHIYIKIRR
jgi:site-specific recombinase XerD